MEKERITCFCDHDFCEAFEAKLCPGCLNVPEMLRSSQKCLVKTCALEGKCKSCISMRSNLKKDYKTSCIKSPLNHRYGMLQTVGGNFSISNIKLKPTEPLNLPITYISQTFEWRQLVESYQYPVYSISANRIWDKETLKLKTKNVKEKLGLRPTDFLILTFWIKDPMLDTMWYEKGLIALRDELDSTDIDAVCSMNFSVYMLDALYENYYSIKRSIISFAEFQKTHLKTIWEWNTNIKEQDELYGKLVTENNIKTAHINFMLDRHMSIGEMIMLLRRRDALVPKDVEFIIGGVIDLPTIYKVLNSLPGRKVYIMNSIPFMLASYRKKINGGSRQYDLTAAELYQHNFKYYSVLNTL